MTWNYFFKFSISRLSGLCRHVFKGGLIIAVLACNDRESKLSFDQSSPVIFDNDDPRDTYTEEYLMALASEGSIQLKGVITSSSYGEYNRWVTENDFENFVALRSDIYKRAVRSGFKNIPAPVRGVKGNLVRPTSGKIEDTAPICSAGGLLIRDEARNASPKEPLVVIAGGALSSVADAYLMDPGIAEKMVVMFLGSSDDSIENGYNGWVDGWATVIAFRKLNIIRYRAVGHDTKDYDPSVPKGRILSDLRDTPLREIMHTKKHPTNPLPDERDADCPPAIHFMRHDYAKNAYRQSFSHETTADGHFVPVLKDDPEGNILFFTSMSKSIATKEWWRAMKHSMNR